MGLTIKKRGAILPLHTEDKTFSLWKKWLCYFFELTNRMNPQANFPRSIGSEATGKAFPADSTWETLRLPIHPMYNCKKLINRANLQRLRAA